MSEMKLIMENWRSYRDEQLEEGCEGSDCLGEYSVGEFLADVGTKTGLVAKFYRKMDQFLESGEMDSVEEKAIKNVAHQLLLIFHLTGWILLKHIG